MTGVIDIKRTLPAASSVAGEIGMSTIDEVRAADIKVRELLVALKSASVERQDQLGIQLQQATDEYAKAIRELPL